MDPVPAPEPKPVDAYSSREQWLDALRAICFLSHSLKYKDTPPMSIRVMANAGPVLDCWIETLKIAISDREIFSLPSNVDIDGLVGGVDLSSTLALGRKVHKQGLLERADGGVLLLAQPTVLEPAITASIANALDDHQTKTERDGVSYKPTVRLACVVIEADEEQISAPLMDRLAMHVDLRSVAIRDLEALECSPELTAAVGELCVDTDENNLNVIAETALAFGISSIRPSQQTAQLAGLSAGFNGRSKVEKEDMELAIRLSLLHRAVMVPAAPENEEVRSEDQPQLNENNELDAQNEGDVSEIDDLTVEAIMANLPTRILDVLSKRQKTPPRSSQTGRVGQNKTSFKRGRPIASIRGKPTSDKRVDILATLRASVPWQKLRNAERASKAWLPIQIRAGDLHLKRFKKPSESTTIFVVDASGSTAVNRLSEAKGAVEMVLSESYARRDYVAMIAMKGREAEIVLPVTRSLVLAKRTLSGLTGGGGTPLADGLKKALILAEEEMRKGHQPSLVILTDGSANVALDGGAGREQANADALDMAKHIAVSGHATLVIDVSKLVGKQAKAVADACRSEYIAMPFANATSISSAVDELQVANAGH